LGVRGKIPQGLKPDVLKPLYGPTSQLGEKVQIEAKWAQIF
jgi:hypothetical protein